VVLVGWFTFTIYCALPSAAAEGGKEGRSTAGAAPETGDTSAIAGQQEVPICSCSCHRAHAVGDRDVNVNSKKTTDFAEAAPLDVVKVGCARCLLVLTG
jgi:hypothetical protein